MEKKTSLLPMYATIRIFNKYSDICCWQSIFETETYNDFHVYLT